VPLVLHGCTGMPEETVKECIAIGMAKINFGTMLRNNFLTYFEDAYHSLDHQGHPWKCKQYAKDKLKEDVHWILSLTGAEGKALRAASSSPRAAAPPRSSTLASRAQCWRRSRR